MSESLLQAADLPFLENGQTRALCSTDSLSVPFGASTRVMLDEAKENVVELIEVAATVDEFDAFLLLLRERLGWGKLWYRRRNRDPGAPADRAPSESTRKQILRR